MTTVQQRGRTTAIVVVALAICAGLGAFLLSRAERARGDEPQAAAPRADLDLVTQVSAEARRLPVPEPEVASPTPQPAASSHYGPLDSAGRPNGGIDLSFYLGTAGGDSLPRFGYWSAQDGGEHPSKIVWVRYDQFPDLYDKLDEARYLRRRFEGSGGK